MAARRLKRESSVWKKIWKLCKSLWVVWVPSICFILLWISLDLEANVRDFGLTAGFPKSAIGATVLVVSAPLRYATANVVSMAAATGIPQRIRRRANFTLWKINSSLPASIPTWSIAIPSGKIDARLPTIEELDQDARALLPVLEDLKSHTFFRIFKIVMSSVDERFLECESRVLQIDLSKECPFWARREMCTTPGACNVCECDDADIPVTWRQRPIENFVDRHLAEKVTPWGQNNNDGSQLHENESTSPKNTSVTGVPLNRFGFASISDEEEDNAVYVDLSLNRPGFTGYAGRNIWSLIYKENCMGAAGRTNLIGAGIDTKGLCTEEEIFYRIVSGMQTLIMVLSAEYNTPRTTPLQYIQEIERIKSHKIYLTADIHRNMHNPNLDLFKNRVAPMQEWIENMYVAFGVLLRSFCSLTPILEQVKCETGNAKDDAAARIGLQKLLELQLNTCRKMQASSQFAALPLFQRKHEVAMRQFSNISRIMDCLECEKCRLHGKVKIVALQLALRASGSDGAVRRVERNEIIALINALDYFADGIAVLHKFENRLAFMRRTWITALSVVVIMSAALLYKQKMNR